MGEPTLRHRVRYHETDAQGFFFNSRYLEVADVAMVEFVRNLGYSYADFVTSGADPSVVQATVNFIRPARFDDVIAVDVRCTRVGRSSFQLEMDFFVEDQQITSVQLVYVNVDTKAGASLPLPGEIARLLRMSADTSS